MLNSLYTIILSAAGEIRAAVGGMGFEGNRSLLRLHQGFVRPTARTFTSPSEGIRCNDIRADGAQPQGTLQPHKRACDVPFCVLTHKPKQRLKQRY